MTTLSRLVLFVVIVPVFASCERSPAPAKVVLYTSVDQRFAEEIVAQYTKETGVQVEIATDSEAGKTTGFLRRLQRERERPRCDVWWSSEVFGTIELARDGLFEPYDSSAAADIPNKWKSADHLWTAFAARARVIGYHPDRIAADAVPQVWADCDEPGIASRMAIANPNFGTTRGHVAALFAYWGEQPAVDFLQKLRDAHTTIADGNAQCVRLVAGGSADLCWTDTDDVWVAQERGESIELVYPRLTKDGPIVWIPCSAALVAGGPNPDAGRKLIDFLVSHAVERALARSDSQNVPVREALRAELNYDGPVPEPLDFDKVAEALPVAIEHAREILLQ